MFQSLRWRLSILFVSLSTLVCVLFALLGMGLFHLGLTNALDEELAQLGAELLPAVDLSGQEPQIMELAKVAPVQHEKLEASIQIYNSRGRLLTFYGPSSIPGLRPNKSEFKVDPYSMRVYSDPLEGKNDRVIGYLQILHPTQARDQATVQFGLSMLMVSPLLLAALGVAGYFFSIRAVRPIEETMRILRQFMADAGHELSTPISIIQVNAEALEIECADKDLPTDRASVIIRTTSRMGKLVSDLTLLSSMESPKLKLQFAALDLQDLAKACKEEFSELFRNKNISVEMDMGQPSMISGSADYLKHMIGNLLTNAIRYTDSGGKVKISVRTQGRYAQLKVSDTGIGIPPESLSHLFDRFYRVDKSRSRAQGGSGLGLAIVKAIAEAHTGKVEVDSETGKGTTFTISLPLDLKGAKTLPPAGYG